MIELTKYRCDHCGTEYADKQKEQQCEGGHRLPQQIKKERKMGNLINAQPQAMDEPTSSQGYDKNIPEVMSIAADPIVEYMSRPQLEKSIERTRKLMTEAAKRLDFLEAAQYRDELLKLEDILKGKE